MGLSSLIWSSLKTVSYQCIHYSVSIKLAVFNVHAQQWVQFCVTECTKAPNCVLILQSHTFVFLVSTSMQTGLCFGGGKTNSFERKRWVEAGPRPRCFTLRRNILVKVLIEKRTDLSRLNSVSRREGIYHQI